MSQEHETQAVTRKSSPVPAGRPTLYEILQVSPTAPLPVIEAAYQALQGGARPGDRTGGKAGPYRLQLFRAYRILSDPARRATYDLKLEEEPSARTAPVEGPEPEVEARATTCWRCGVPLSIAARYCSACHWLICGGCRACGCENPTWQQPRPVRVVRWPLAAAIAFTALLLAVVAIVAFRSGACGGPLAAIFTGLGAVTLPAD